MPSPHNPRTPPRTCSAMSWAEPFKASGMPHQGVPQNARGIHKGEMFCSGALGRFPGCLLFVGKRPSGEFAEHRVNSDTNANLQAEITK